MYCLCVCVGIPIYYAYVHTCTYVYVCMCVSVCVAERGGVRERDGREAPKRAETRGELAHQD